MIIELPYTEEESVIKLYQKDELFKRLVDDFELVFDFTKRIKVQSPYSDVPIRQIKWT